MSSIRCRQEPTSCLTGHGQKPLTSGLTSSSHQLTTVMRTLRSRHLCSGAVTFHGAHHPYVPGSALSTLHVESHLVLTTWLLTSLFRCREVGQPAHIYLAGVWIPIRFSSSKADVIICHLMRPPQQNQKHTLLLTDRHHSQDRYLCKILGQWQKQGFGHLRKWELS